MSSVFLTDRRLVQPQDSFKAEGDGLIAAFFGSNLLYDGVTQQLGSIVGAADQITKVPALHGRSTDFNPSVAAAVMLPKKITFDGSTSWSIFVRTRADASAIIFGEYNTTTSWFRIDRGGNRFIYTPASGSNSISAGAISADWHDITLSWELGGTLRIFYDGALRSTATGVNGSFVFDCFGYAYNTLAYMYDGAIEGCLVRNRASSLDEHRADRGAGSLRVVRASPRRLYFDVPTGGGITGTLSVTETGSDTASLSGIVLVQGTVSATETTVDIFAASGGSGAITGTLSVTESGPDVFSCSGTILISGSLTATESTTDTLSISGVVLIQGSLTATEGTSDVFSATNVAPAANKTVNSKWLVSLGSTGGTVQLQMASEVNGVNVTLQDGLLFLKYRKI